MASYYYYMPIIVPPKSSAVELEKVKIKCKRSDNTLATAVNEDEQLLSTLSFPFPRS